MLTLVKNVKEKLCKFNNAIFNGCTSAQVIEIDLVKTEFKNSATSANNYIKRYMINIDNSTSDISKGKDLKLDKDTINISIPSFRNIFEDDETVERRVRGIRIKVDDMTSPIIGNAVARTTAISIGENIDDKNHYYSIDLISSVNLPMTRDQLNNYGASSGIIKRRFFQNINVDNNIEAIIIILPRTSSIPLIFTFKDKQNIDLNNIFENNPSYIDTSFDKDFEFNDNIQLSTKLMNISSDKDFVKVNAILDIMPEAKIDKAKNGDNGADSYRYEDDIILGIFESNNEDYVEFFLKGKDQNYLYYSNKENYNVSPFEFFDVVKEYVDNGEGLDEVDYRKNARDLFQTIFNDGYLRQRLGLYPIGNINIFKEIGSNFNTYHYYIKDDMGGLERIITIYNGEYILVREYPIKSPMPCCYLTLLKHSDSGKYNQIINSKISLTDDNCNISHYWNFVLDYNKSYSASGLLKQNKVCTEDLVNFEVCKEIAYQSPELENFVYQQFVEDKKLKDSVTRFDSVIYSHESLDDTILYNYLGLPVNFRYIKFI